MSPHPRDKNLINFHIGTGNLHSITNKSELLHDHILQQNYDAFVIIETWLKNSDKDRMYVGGNSLNSGSYNIHMVNNTGSKNGGGVALVIKSNFKTKQLCRGCSDTMEYGVWSVKLRNVDITLVGINHLPGRSNNTEFINNFITLIGEIRTPGKNLIIPGYLNLHINDPRDIEAGEFMDTIEALGLKNYVNFPTHRDNNTLDLVISDELSKLKPIYIKPGPFLSDHCTVSILYNVTKLPIPIKEIKLRRIKDVPVDILIKDMKQFNKNITDALYKHVPLKPSKITVMDRKPWYNNQLHDQLKRVRNRDRVWRKYKEAEHWKAYQNEWLIYNKMLYKFKSEYIKNEVDKFRGDSEHLYKLIASLMGIKNSNPLPETSSDGELAERFINFFIGKIKKIRNDLGSFEKLTPPVKPILLSLEHFTTLGQKEVKHLVNKLQTKSCEIDVIPTYFIKDN